jgi:hypothetical protein
VRTTVVIDYHDAWTRAGEAFGLDAREAQFDPVCCAETLAGRSRVAGAAVLERVVVHHPIPERQFDRAGFRRGQQRAERWREADPRVATQIRSLRLPRHDPDGTPEAKGVASAIALDVAFLLERGEAEHVIVLSHRADLIALSAAVRARTQATVPGLEYGSWRSRSFRITVPNFGALGNVLLLRHDFEACQEQRPAGSE